ncbi:DUF6328 family protein [Nocardioides jiangxiensis]|uniref:DUF6328 family protein n=1 Tax=Nocardioides jiangxiensis TaxID=3064524 RepID=A0ABT9B0B8_9ACTN|nr:DUF6328 family protein [Nocardioides sp. WY-20]MDO7868294.1 DUF6328 family protein [Nocardioides sp. WY-20]
MTANDSPAAQSHHLDRELNELLQELRVIQGGILLLVGFLLVIAFSAGFARATDFQRVVYYLTLLVTGVAAIIVVAPVVHHRMAFRRRDKERVVVRGNHQILAAIGLVSLSILGILTLVTDYLFGSALTVVIDVLYAGLVTLFWVVLPLHSLRMARHEGNGAP